MFNLIFPPFAFHLLADGAGTESPSSPRRDKVCADPPSVSPDTSIRMASSRVSSPRSTAPGSFEREELKNYAGEASPKPEDDSVQSTGGSNNKEEERDHDDEDDAALESWWADNIRTKHCPCKLFCVRCLFTIKCRHHSDADVRPAASVLNACQHASKPTEFVSILVVRSRAQLSMILCR